ncbi:hypothetical protein [Pseudacidovorax sp. RU35E]|nr:hypothetical protein [Pseudacidovorax sp. RU35E]
MKPLFALLAGLAFLLAGCNDKPKPGAPVPKAEAPASSAFAARA